MEYWAIAVIALVLSALFAFIVGGIGRKSTRKAHREPHGPQKPAEREPCPLCGARLLPGERIRSELFPGEGQRLTHIWGCPHCFPPNDRFPRSCPVCRTPLEPEGFVVGRMWERPPRGGTSRPRSHLHIVGCAACRTAGRKERG